MAIVAKLDDYGRPAWIATTILAFIVWWPLGIATLAFAFGSGRMMCGMRGKVGRWYNMDAREQPGGGRHRGWRMARGGGSGNRAFDEYRDETMRRLEEEEREFREFLERLRQAKDKAEFDQFMADRRRGDAGSGATAEN